MVETVVIPVKSFSLGKQRLSSALNPDVRARLGRGLANHVASTVVGAGLVPLIVTADPEVAEWSMRTGFPSLADPGAGLDEAASTGVGWVRHIGATWLVLHGDLPLLTAEDVGCLAAVLEAGGSVIAPSADGGTSAIGGREPIEFAFGRSSFHRHLSRLTDPDVIARTGLLHDLDSPTDLVSSFTTPRGRWVAELIGRI